MKTCFVSTKPTASKSLIKKSFKKSLRTFVTKRMFYTKTRAFSTLLTISWPKVIQPVSVG